MDKIDFLNCHKDKYAWDNGDLDDNYMDLVEDEVSHPHISANITGVDLASETPVVSQGISREYGAI